MLGLDRPLAFLARSISHVRGTTRLFRPLRHWCSSWYADSPNSWTTIGNYRGRLKIRLDRAAYMGGAIYWHGAHHGLDLAYLEANVAATDVFIDAGANIGEFVVAIADRVRRGRVLAFEPHPAMADVLEENVRLNGYSNVVVFRSGLSNKQESVELYTSLDRSQFHGVHEGLFTRYPDEYRNVAMGTVLLRPLDDVLEECGIGQVDWLKIDVEGGELALLEGARITLERHRPIVILEINEPTYRSAGYSVKTVLNLLDRFGYCAYRVGRNSIIRSFDPLTLGDKPANVFFYPEGSNRLPI